jgi:hypothetical protein
LSRLRASVDRSTPDLRAALDRLAAKDPGLHVTLYEFANTRGHAHLPSAVQWCERFGAKLADEVACLGPVILRGVAINRTNRGANLSLTAWSPPDWLGRLMRICAEVDPPLPQGGRRPERLHATIARNLGSRMEPSVVRERCPVDLLLEFNRFSMALATEWPYGGLRWQHTSRSHNS